MNHFKKTIQINQFLALDGIKFASVVTSFINVIVFSQKSMRGHPLFRYLLAMSVSDFVYSLSMVMMIPLSTACFWVKENNKDEDVDITICYVFYKHNLLFQEYLTSCLALFNIILEIIVTCQRIRLLSREARSENMSRPWVVCVLAFGFSLAFYSPVLFMNEVYAVETRNETTSAVRRDYLYGKTKFGKSVEGLFLAKLLALVRIILVTVVLTIANIIASIKFTAFIVYIYLIVQLQILE
jgi:hypothetical protein